MTKPLQHFKEKTKKKCGLLVKWCISQDFKRLQAEKSQPKNTNFYYQFTKFHNNFSSQNFVIHQDFVLVDHCSYSHYLPL